MRKKNVPLLLVIILIAIAAVVAGTVFLTSNSYSREYLETGEIFGLQENEAAVLVDGSLSEEKAYVINGRVFLPYDLVASFTGNPFYYEAATGRLYLTLQNANNIWTARTARMTRWFRRRGPVWQISWKVLKPVPPVKKLNLN